MKKIALKWWLNKQRCIRDNYSVRMCLQLQHLKANKTYSCENTVFLEHRYGNTINFVYELSKLQIYANLVKCKLFGLQFIVSHAWCVPYRIRGDGRSNAYKIVNKKTHSKRSTTHKMPAHFNTSQISIIIINIDLCGCEWKIGDCAAACFAVIFIHAGIK